MIRRDSRFNFIFCSLQSEAAKEILSAHNEFVKNLNTLVLIEDGRLFTRSTAILRILKQLDGGWKYLKVFAVMPGFFRDAVYWLISKSRYIFFGKRKVCIIPTPALKERFL